MYKLSLVLLLVSSTFLCQARPDGTGQNSNSAVNAESVKQKNNEAKSELSPFVAVQKGDESTNPSSTNQYVVQNGSTITDSTHGEITVTPKSIPPPPPSSSTTHTPPPKPSTSTTKPTIPPPSSSSTSSSTSTTSTTSTIHPPTSPTTEHPKPDHHTDGFSLVSFLGGMILGLGLLAIAYVVFKFYQTRRDSSYRTL